MNDANFISPFPFNPYPPIVSNSMTIGGLTLSEAAYLFWNVKSAILDLSVFVNINDKDGDNYYNISRSINLNGADPASVAGTEPQKRALARPVGAPLVSVFDEIASFSVFGPYYEEDYSDDVAFANRRFAYQGSLILSTPISLMPKGVADPVDIVSSHGFTLMGRAISCDAIMSSNYMQEGYFTQRSVSVNVGLTYY